MVKSECIVHILFAGCMPWYNPLFLWRNGLISFVKKVFSYQAIYLRGYILLKVSHILLWTTFYLIGGTNDLGLRISKTGLQLSMCIGASKSCLPWVCFHTCQLNKVEKLVWFWRTSLYSLLVREGMLQLKVKMLESSHNNIQSLKKFWPLISY